MIVLLTSVAVLTHLFKEVLEMDDDNLLALRKSGARNKVSSKTYHTIPYIVYIRI